MSNLPAASPERLSRLLHAASSISRAAASILAIEDFLQRGVDLVCETLDYPFAGVFLLDETGQWAELSAAHGEAGQKMFNDGFKLAVGGNSMVGMAARMRSVRIASDIDAETEFLRNPHLHLPNAHAEIALPMVVGDDVVGVFSVQSMQSNAFTREDVDTLAGAAGELAVAVKHSRLNRANQEMLRISDRRARLFQAASKVGKQVTSILDLEELLPRMCDIICEAYGFYYAGVFLLDDSGEQAVLVAGHGEAGRKMLAQNHKLAVGGHSMIGMATALGEARIALDVGEERVHFKNPVLPYTRSEMALPLRVAVPGGEQILGAVTVQSVEERAFSSDDILTLQTMADQLAVAINNARLLHNLEAANRELLRTKTFEALTASTTSAIHWIGNKALPITTTVARMQADLESGKLDPVSLKEDLAMVAENASLIVAVKENLLGQAREHKPRPAMLNDVARAAAMHAGLPEGMLRIESAPDAPLAIIDTAQMARALGNLYRNSVEAGARHIDLQVDSAPGGYVQVRVADDGQGISPDMLNKMWAPFTSSKGPGHTGLGLTAIQHVVAQQHGRVSAQSQPGAGAIFEILLPADMSEAVAGLASAPEMAAVKKPVSVLLIDDDDDWSRFAVQTLKAAGVACQQRPSPVQADLDKAGLILVDEALERAALEDVLAVLAQAGAASKTVVISADPSVERTTLALKRGVRDLTLKPYTAADLVALL